MSVRVISWAWDQHTTPTEKLVLVCLADHANDSGYCFPSIPGVVEKTGLSKSSVIRSLETLETCGLISRERSKGGRGCKSSYQLSTPKHSQSETVSHRNGFTVTSKQSHSETKQSHSGTRTVKNRKEPSYTSKVSDFPVCPHEEIIELYHSILPELNQTIPSTWKGGSKRAKSLRTRWREKETHRKMEFWKWFFESVRLNTHWLGENERGWKADLEWLLKASNFVKVIERGMNEQRA